MCSVAAAVLGFAIWLATDGSASEAGPPDELRVSAAAGGHSRQRALEPEESSEIGAASSSDQSRPQDRVLVVQTKAYREIAIEHRDIIDYFSRMLKRAGRRPVSGDALIAEADIKGFLQAIAKSRESVGEYARAWNSAVNARTDRVIEEIDKVLKSGGVPPYRVLKPGERLPSAKGFDKVGVHRPAGSSEAYVIEFPETMFLEQVGALRDASRMQAELFDGALRSLFDK